MKHARIWILLALLPLAQLRADIVSDVTNANLVTNTMSYLPGVSGMNDRQQHAGQAQSDSDEGKGVAIATGIGLMTAGSELLSHWWSIPDQVAGGELMYRAKQEFDQAFHDSGVADANRDQKLLLSNEATQAHTNYDPTADITNAISNSPLGDQLAQNGVDVNNFAQQFTSGQLDSGQSIQTALGINTGEVSSEAREQANQLLESKTGEVLASNSPDSGKFGFNNSGSGGGGKGANGGEGKEGGLPDGWNGEPLDTTTAAMRAALLADAKRATASVPTGGNEGAGAYNLPTINNLFNKLFPNEKKVALSQQALAVKGKLEKAGVRMVRSKENLFQVAGRNYRDYSHWRKMAVASTTSADIR